MFYGCPVSEDAKWSLELKDLGQSSSLRVKIEVYNCLNGQFYSDPWLGLHWPLFSSLFSLDKARSWHLEGLRRGPPPGAWSMWICKEHVAERGERVRRQLALISLLKFILRLYLFNLLLRSLSHWKAQIIKAKRQRKRWFKNQEIIFSFPLKSLTLHIARSLNCNPLSKELGSFIIFMAVVKLRR